MLEKFTKGSYTIGAGQALSGKISAPRTVRITGSRIWLTIEGQSHDYWLKPGESLTLPSNRLIVLEADQGDSRVEFMVPGTKIAMTKPHSAKHTDLNACKPQAI
jgi:hypothetical protein